MQNFIETQNRYGCKKKYFSEWKNTALSFITNLNQDEISETQWKLDTMAISKVAFFLAARSFPTRIPSVLPRRRRPEGPKICVIVHA